MTMGQGFTSCGDGVCQPGQYCDLAAFCEVGCVSDVNCAQNQSCDTANPDFRGISQCVNNVGIMDAGPGPDARLGHDSGPASGPCDEAAQQLLDCGEIDNLEFAEIVTACNTGAFPAVQRMAFVTCVTAGSTCAAKGMCIPRSTSCVSDSECNTMRGDQTHEICEAGSCGLGCRDDFDCGDSSSCETFINQCVPDF